MSGFLILQAFPPIDHPRNNNRKQPNLVNLPNTNLIKRPTEYNENLKTRGLGVLGFQQALNAVNSLNKMGRSRRKKWLQDLNAKSDFTHQSDLINELNDKANRAIQFYRQQILLPY